MDSGFENFSGRFGVLSNYRYPSSRIFNQFSTVGIGAEQMVKEGNLMILFLDLSMDCNRTYVSMFEMYSNTILIQRKYTS